MGKGLRCGEEYKGKKGECVVTGGLNVAGSVPSCCRTSNSVHGVE